MNKLLYLFFFIVCCSCVNSASKDYYGLSLSKGPLNLFRWSFNVGDDSLRWKPTWVVDPEINRQVFCAEEEVSLKARLLPLAFELSQRFPLFSPYRKADVWINTREENVKDTWLKVYALNKREEVVRADSVRISGKKWRKHHIRITTDSASYLLVHLRVKSVPDTSVGAKMWIDKVDVRLDGLSVNEVSRPEQGKNPILDPEQLVPLSFSDDSSIDRIPLLQTPPRIIGLGETMSGSLSLGKAKNQIIKRLVEYKNCKLVVLNVPSMIPLKWDLYIQGYPIPLQEIVEDAGGTTLTREEITELLEFLKVYNSKQTNRVRIIGIDRNEGVYNYDLLCGYLYEIYRQKPDPHIRALIESFYSSPAEIFPLLNDPRTEECIGRFETKWLRGVFYLRVMEAELLGVTEYGVLNSRGTILWEHLYKAWHATGLSKDECMVITGPWTQLSRKSTLTRYPSLGEYLAEYYGKEYCSIGLLGGNGNITSVRLETWKTDQDCPLPKPEAGSLEKSAWDTRHSFFYYPAESLPRYPLSIRIIPLAYEMRFQFPANLHERMDGFVFVRESTSGESLRGEELLSVAIKKTSGKRIKQFLEQCEAAGINILPN